MLEDLLTMTDITIIKESQTSDGMGDYSSTTTSTILPKGVIYQAGQGATRYLSSKLTAESSHVLVCLPSVYSFTSEDKRVTHNGKTYIIQGQPEDVLEYGEVMVVGLKLQV